MSSAGDAMAPKDGMSYATSEPMPATYCALGAAATHRQKRVSIISQLNGQVPIQINQMVQKVRRNGL
ncbi:homocitrate synthase [Aspergillus luchuensis]|uniref:Homocitrate synthase n=1 Tax=Aspergillus kawachii TaxID=1069201 RepID=A0A146FFC0_ASPKA|nr:homocitrate synthase [Aspergillus luchuensis]